MLYPLVPGNQWTYVQKDGSSFTNRVTAADPTRDQQFVMVNSVLNKDQRIRRDGAAYLTDSFEEGNFQVLLRDDLKPGDTWDITFKANGLDSLLVMTVKETGVTREVEGRTYDGVVLIEAESRIVMNGTVMPIGFFTQYHYAEDVGLVLTTTSAGDRMALSACELK